MPIHSLELTNVGPFRRRPDGSGSDGIKLEFNANVNLLIGPNNVGKSTVLWFLAGLGTGRNGVLEALSAAISEPTFDPAPRYVVEYTNLGGERDKIGGVSLLEDFGVDSAVGQQLSIGYVGHDDGSVPDMAVISYPPTLPADDDNPLLDSEHLSNMLSETRFDSNQYGHILSAFQNSRHERDKTAAATISTVAAAIFSSFPVEFAAATSAGNGITGEHTRMSKTMDVDIAFGQLSHGTRSVFSSIFHLAVGMARYYWGNSDWKNQPGVFIIDEIDAHLHPSWQRRIIPTLQQYFPNVQIFASTHSPLMVAGLKKGQVHLLQRDETGQVVWSRNEQDIIGWTADEIYRTFMGVDDPTDELTMQRANRLRELRDRETRTEAEEDEMNALRRQVNEDLLAKGRINAQRERYAGLMEQFLRSRMSELSQDGG